MVLNFEACPSQQHFLSFLFGQGSTAMNEFQLSIPTKIEHFRLRP